jgi:tetratricopeptide (TPR) repeat protein
MNTNDPFDRTEPSLTTVSRIIEKSGYCNRIMDTCIELKEKIEQTRDEKTLLELNGTLQLKLNRMLKLKEYAINIHETFRTIPRRSKRLQQAREHFYRGEFQEMDGVLDAEKIRAEIESLDGDRHSEDPEQRAKARLRLACRSYELVIKALFRHTFIDDPGWYEDAYHLLDDAHQASYNVHALYELAIFLTKTVEKEWALQLLDDAHTMAGDLNGDDCRRYRARCHEAKGFLAKMEQNFPEAIEHTGKALKIYTQLSETNPAEYRPKTADMLMYIGDYHTFSKNFATALVVFEEAVKIRRGLALPGNWENAMQLAHALDKLASVHVFLGEYPEAIPRFEEALEIENSHLEYNLYMVLAAKAGTLYNLSVALYCEKKYGEAIRRTKEELEARKEVQATDPFGQLPLIARARNMLANSYLDLQRPEDAIREREKIVKLYKTLVKHTPETWLCSLGESLNYCSNLHFRMKSYGKYILTLKEALDTFRKLAATDPAEYRLTVGCLLANVCHYYEQISPDRKKMLEAARESFRILSSVEERNETAETAYARLKEILKEDTP